MSHARGNNPYHVSLNCGRDGRTHMVSHRDFVDGVSNNRGTYRAECGTHILAGSLTRGGADCLACTRVGAANVAELAEGNRNGGNRIGKSVLMQRGPGRMRGGISVLRRLVRRCGVPELLLTGSASKE